MAIGARSIEGLSPDLPAPEAAAIALRHRLDPIPRLLKRAARAGRGKSAAEDVHQLRVATRRAGAALDAFAELLDAPSLAKARKRLKRLRRAAGGVRESDVAIATLLKQRKGADPAERAALDHLIADTRQRRSASRRDLRKAADRYPPAKLRRAQRKLLRPLAAPPGSPDRAPSYIPTLLDIADATIDAYLASLRHAASSDLRDLQNVHELRISVKRLRYALELFEPCLERDGAEDAYARLSALQERLGDINDASQLLDRLDAAVAAIHPRDDAVSGEDADDEGGDAPADSPVLAGLLRLTRACREQLAAAHAGFLADWSHGEVAALADRLCLLTAHESPCFESRPADAPAEARPAPDAAPDAPRHAGNGRASHQPQPPAHGIVVPDGRTRIAAIDIGTNSIRLIIAEADPASGDEPSYRILDDEKEIARLGRGLDSTGIIDPEAMSRAALVVGRMHGIARGYGVRDIRVVGTAVVREAANGRDFVDLVRQNAGLEVEVISAEEEAKLAFLSASHAFDLTSAPAAVVDIGGGSTEIVLTAAGVVDRVYLIPLGAVRLTERFGGPIPAATERFDEMAGAIRDAFRDGIGKLPLIPHILVGTGGTFTALGNMARHAELGPEVDGLFAGSVQGHEVRRSEVRHLLEHLRTLSPRDRERFPGLSPDRADIIVAGLALVDGLMKRLEVNRALVHEGGIRDGLLLQMVAGGGGGVSGGAGGVGGVGGRDPMRSVLRFARTCGYEHRHCDHVASLSTQIFDRLGAEPAGAFPGSVAPDLFTPRNRLLLHAAAILHDVGYLINYARHHKHSYHLIVHADLPGLTAREVEIVANLARYHRRGEPDREHRNYDKLSREDRAIVSGLAAILRIADGLDRTHMQHVRAVRLVVSGGEARFLAEAPDEPEVDLWGALRKAELFEKHFGLTAKFEWAGPPAAEPARQAPAPPPVPQGPAAPAELVLPPDFASAQPLQ